VAGVNGILLFLLLLAVTFFIRARVFLGGKGARNTFGCDAFYFLISVRELKKNGRKIPYTLPYYFLDIKEQWYPPGFVVFLSMLPEKILENYHRFINPVLDLVQSAFLYCFIIYISSGKGNGFAAALIAASAGLIVYAVIPNLNTENLSMNVRTFASLINTALLLMIIFYKTAAPVSLYGKIFIIVSLLLCGFILFMTHKMAVQNFVFMMASLSILKMDAGYIFLPAAIVAATLILSGGFYLKVLRAHTDILIFWKKNLENLCVRQYEDSPVYGGRPEDSQTRFHMPGIRGFVKHFKVISGFNPFAVFLAVYPFLGERITLFNPGCSASELVWWWGILTYFMVFATTYIKPLRFLGEGWKYIKFAAFPTAFITADILSYALSDQSSAKTAGIFVVFLFVACLVLSVLITLRLQNKFRGEHTMGILDENLTAVFDHIKSLEGKSLVCIPTHISNAAVFYTGKKVLWGGHSIVSSLEGFFPVIMHPLEYYIKKYGISYVVLDTSYISPEKIKLSSYRLLFNSGRYNIYETGVSSYHDEVHKEKD